MTTPLVIHCLLKVGQSGSYRRVDRLVAQKNRHGVYLWKLDTILLGGETRWTRRGLPLKNPGVGVVEFRMWHLRNPIGLIQGSVRNRRVTVRDIAKNLLVRVQDLGLWWSPPPEYKWWTETVANLTTQIWDHPDRRAGLAPILADALEEAGCPDDHAMLEILRNRATPAA